MAMFIGIPFLKQKIHSTNKYEIGPIIQPIKYGCFYCTSPFLYTYFMGGKRRIKCNSCERESKGLYSFQPWGLIGFKYE